MSNCPHIRKYVRNADEELVSVRHTSPCPLCEQDNRIRATITTQTEWPLRVEDKCLCTEATPRDYFGQSEQIVNPECLTCA